jgi:membrane-associated phospholipid phosphatase
MFKKTAMMKKVLILLFVVFIAYSSVIAQERDSALVAKVFKHGLNDAKSLFTSPVQWSGRQWLTAGAVTTATAAVVLWADEPVYDFANKMHTPSRDVFFKYAEPLGNNYAFAVMGITLATGIIAKNNYHVETAFIAAESYLFTGLITQAVKITAGRKRPNADGTTHPHDWEGPFFNGNSFFSGHTSTAFAVATVYAQRYKHQPWVPIVSYSLAALGGLQRIYGNRHWAGDVLMGAAVGTATGLLLSKQWQKNPIRFYPIATNGGAGFSMVYQIQ